VCWFVCMREMGVMGFGKKKKKQQQQNISKEG
jgi:hypothetical protein